MKVKFYCNYAGCCNEEILHDEFDIEKDLQLNPESLELEDELNIKYEEWLHTNFICDWDFIKEN